MTVALALIPESLAFAAVREKNFIELFNYNEDPENIIIDFSNSHIWDHSAVTAVLKVVHKYRKLNNHVTIIELNKESQLFICKVGAPKPSLLQI